MVSARFTSVCFSSSFQTRTRRVRSYGWPLTNSGNPPAFSVRQKWSYAAIANFIAGVIPPSAMLGRSWLYVHSQRVALS